MDSSSDEGKVAQSLEACGLLPLRFTKAEKRRNRRTPDFRVGGPYGPFYCEVVSLERHEDDLPIGLGFGRLEDKVHKAACQFADVNPYRVFPNVLAWVVHEWRARVLDLELILAGQLTAADAGPVLPFTPRYCGGRIRAERLSIDLHLWFQYDANEPSFFFARSNDRHHEVLRRTFERQLARGGPVRHLPPARRLRAGASRT